MTFPAAQEVYVHIAPPRLPRVDWDGTPRVLLGGWPDWTFGTPK